MKTAVATTFLVACLALVAARSAYQLPAGFELLRSNIITSFSCVGRPFGYYADVDNDCALFHICQPVSDEIGNVIEEAQFTFMCGNLTMFSQESLTCASPSDAYPCELAESLFDLSNADFGKIPEETFTFDSTIQ